MLACYLVSYLSSSLDELLRAVVVVKVEVVISIAIEEEGCGGDLKELEFASAANC